MNNGQSKAEQTTPSEIMARQGLRLPAEMLKSLKSAGIYSQPTVSLEHQHLAKKYVLRGVESGGAVADLGAYCSFIDEEGQAIVWLQRVDSIAVNGVHAIAVAPTLVRLQLVRVHHTYDLLISQHNLSQTGAGRRPTLQSSILFYGRRGSLEMDLCDKDSRFHGMVRPMFFSRSGEQAAIPAKFEEAIIRLTAAVNCVGCRHSHLLQPPGTVADTTRAPEAEEVIS